MSISKIKSTLGEFIQLARIPGNKAPFIRLCLVAAILVGSLLLSFFNLPPITQGLGAFLYAIFTYVNCGIVFAVLVWIFAKWMVFILPKSRAVGDFVCSRIVALSLVGLVIKMMIWLYFLLVPVTLYGMMLMPLTYLVHILSLMESEFLVALEENEEGETILDRLPDQSPGTLPDEVVEDREFRKIMLAMIDELPAGQRSALMLYYYERLSVKQIAEIQDENENTIKAGFTKAEKP